MGRFFLIYFCQDGVDNLLDLPLYFYVDAEGPEGFFVES